MTTVRRSASVDLFDINSTNLRTVLDDIHYGRTKLPNFHREWCWPSGHIRSLVGSIAEGHPIGSPMMVSAVPSGYRSFDGASIAHSNSPPMHLVLDGQQRLTAAYQACYTRAPVRLRSGLSLEHRLYYFVMEKAVSLGGPVEDAIFSIATTPDGAALHRGFIDYADPLVQYERGIFPTNLVFDFGAYERAYSEFWDGEERGPERSNALETLRQFRAVIARSFETYKVSVQMLKRPLQAAALCRLYGKLNGCGANS